MKNSNGFTQRQIRILHVLGMMERAGAETWLMHILRTLDRSRYQMDFLVHSPEPQEYDDELRALGSNLIVLPHIHRPLRYARGINRILRDNGPYDVVHSHVHQYSGFVLRLAKRAGVPIRIAHSHLDASAIEARASLPRRAYLRLMRHWLEGNMTAGLSVSGVAAADLFGPHWACDPRHQLLFCGIEMEPFCQPVCKAAVRGELGIPEHAFVVGHVGRFAEQKNHTFLLDIAAAVVQCAPEVRFLLVGDGGLREAMEAKAAALGLTERMIFAGPRADVPRLMLGAMDAFLLPSQYEGLPLVLMEAQAAGLPCVFSDNTAREADIVPALVRRRSLAVPASGWAETLLEVRASGPAISRDEAFAIAEATPFNIHTSWNLLERVYVKHEH
jgi:glycosyltransferase involved in cell wall biosynthesis